MTDWRTLPAGRELDCLIAKRLGWQFIRFSKNQLIARHDGVDYQADDWLGIPPDAEEKHLYEHVIPHYSTELDAALLLVRGIEWELGGSEKGDYYADVAELYMDDLCPHGSANTPALALCRAWLEWKETQETSNG